MHIRANWSFSDLISFSTSICGYVGACSPYKRVYKCICWWACVVRVVKDAATVSRSLHCVCACVGVWPGVFQDTPSHRLFLMRRVILKCKCPWKYARTLDTRGIYVLPISANMRGWMDACVCCCVYRCHPCYIARVLHSSSAWTRIERGRS